MKKKVQMKKMAGVFLALAILGIGLFPPGNVYAAANQAPDADPVVVVLDPGHGGHDHGADDRHHFPFLYLQVDTMEHRLAMEFFYQAFHFYRTHFGSRSWRFSWFSK